MTVNDIVFDGLDTGDGLFTTTKAVPEVSRSAAEIDAVSWLEFTKVVGLLEPFQLTVAPLTKLVPLTVRVKAEPFTRALVGLSEVITGVGLLIVNVTGDEVPPPGVGVNTVIAAVPPEVMSDAGIDAVSVVELTKLVVRLFPFHRTVLPFTKFVPVAVSVNAAEPDVTVSGFSVVSDGTGFPALWLIVRVGPEATVMCPVLAEVVVLSVTE